MDWLQKKDFWHKEEEKLLTILLGEKTGKTAKLAIKTAAAQLSFGRKSSNFS